MRKIKNGLAYCSIFSEPDENGDYDGLGYLRDGIHLNWQGSLFMKEIFREPFEKQIVPFATRWASRNMNHSRALMKADEDHR